MSDQPFLSNFDHQCVICLEVCKPAPTERGWINLPGLKGIHYDCLEHVWSAYRIMKHEREHKQWTDEQVDQLEAWLEKFPKNPDYERYNAFTYDLSFDKVIATLDRIANLEKEKRALRNLADLAAKTSVTFEDWLGQASTMQAAKDAMWRLRQALRQNGYPSCDRDDLDWRGSILNELNEAGFYPSLADPYHAERPDFVYDPEAPEHGRIFGNAVGPTIAEIVAEWKGMKNHE